MNQNPDPNVDGAILTLLSRLAEHVSAALGDATRESIAVALDSSVDEPFIAYDNVGLLRGWVTVGATNQGWALLQFGGQESRVGGTPQNDFRREYEDEFASDHDGLSALTRREREVLLLVARGNSNLGIARELFISPKTASVHVSHILDKLNVQSRTQAAALAYRAGLLSRGSQ